MSFAAEPNVTAPIEIVKAGVAKMKAFLGIAVLTLAIGAAAVPANAKGCIKGAIVGGAAGHLAHHGLLGAAAGCIIGRHEAHKKAMEEKQMQDHPQDNHAPDQPATPKL
jgi:hypothetical protein